MHSDARPNVTKTGTPKKLRFGDFGDRWLALKSLQDVPRYRARAYLLSRVAALEPRVLESLGRIDDDDDADLEAWASTWRLPAWVLAYARETLRLWRLYPQLHARVWSPNPADVKGSLVPDTGRRPKRPTAIRIPPQHFDWFVRARVRRESLGSVARSVGVQHYAVSTAIRRLAAILDSCSSRRNTR